MASLRDKLKSKIRPKNQPETMQCFDETSLNVHLIQGKNQLTELKIHCGWTNNKYNAKTPRLKCQWYNRTEKNYQQIIGIEDQSYQPSILDIASIIEVTCIPELPGVAYEGMPILLKSQPILLALETEHEAKKIQQKGKGKFIVNLMDNKISNNSIPNGAEALLQYEKGKLSILLLKVSDASNQITKSIEITQQFPSLTISRSNPRKITMRLSDSESCVVLFKNNEVRDSFCLFLKLFQAQKALSELEKSQPTEPQKQQRAVSSEGHLGQQKIEQQPQSPQQQGVPDVQKESKQPPGEVENTLRQNSTTDLLQLLALKQQIHRLQAESSKQRKQLEAYREKTESLENSLLESNERVQNASKNYFALEQQLVRAQETVKSLQKELTSFKEHHSSKQEEFLYYTTEIKLINEEKSQLQQQMEDLQNRYDALNKEVNNYRATFDCGEKEKSYKELVEELKQLQEMNCELRLKNEFYLDEREKLEEAMKGSREVMEQLEAEKKHIEKKYESLTNQLSSSTISHPSPKKERSNENSLSSSFIYEEGIPCLDNRQSFLKMISSESDSREGEILELKRQLKDYIEQNNYLRSLLAKQKKPSSKTQLKLQLLQAKKIVGRLSQAMSEKESMLGNLRQINRQLNRRNQTLQQHCQQLVQQLQHNN